MVMQARDTGLLRNSRLMGIPEFKSMANDVEVYRRSKVCSFGVPAKAEGVHGFQEKFYWILGALLWRVCENYDDIPQADFYKLYRWFHITRKLLKPPPPMPDYVSPFAKKNGRKEPVATIRMTTRTSAPLDALYTENDNSMRSKVDPSKYLGSNISLTESITSTLRLGTPHLKPASDALLQALTEPDQLDRESAGKQRALGTLRGEQRTEQRSSTAPTGIRRSVSQVIRPTSSTLPTLQVRSTQSMTKGRYGYEINGEVDADATLVDVDGILDQGSDAILRDTAVSPGARTLTPRNVSPAHTTPPLPSADVLSKRQLKLIGTNAANGPCSTSPVSADKTFSDIINAPVPAVSSNITPSVLMEMAGSVGERMMVNRARLLLLQHNTEHNIIDRGTCGLDIKPPTAPPGVARPSPLPSLHSMESSRTTPTERATTAPITRAPILIRRSSIKSSKLRSSTASWSVPCRSESRAREDALREPFTIQSFNPQQDTTAPKSPYPVPPPSASSMSLTSSSFKSPRLARTPHKERCAIYKDPTYEARGYTPLEDDEIHTLSETPLLQIGQEHFSSLSSFLPSNQSLVS